MKSKQSLNKGKALLCFIIISIFISANNFSFAHFGSKGPYGGDVSCIATYDTNTVYLGTLNGGVFESTTSGVTAWKPRPVGLKSGKITSIVHTGSYLFAGTADSGVYIFTGFIGTDRYWKKINNGLPNLKITSLVAIDSITVLVGTDGNGIFKTSDKGATWVDANVGLDDYIITGFAKTGNRILEISDGGVYASDDNGLNWIDMNDLNTDHVFGSAISYCNTSKEMLIYNINGLFISANADTSTLPSYTAANNGLPPNTIVRAISNDGTTWYLATDKGVFTSPVGTINWTIANTGINTLDITAISPFRNKLIVGTNGEGTFKSSVSSISWTVNNSGFNNIRTYSMITSGVDVVIAATEKGVFVNRNLGTTQTRANNGLTDSLNVSDLTFFGSNLYATTLNDGVFFSADTGRTWSTFNAGLSNLNLKKVIASATNIFIFDSNGEVLQSDGIAAWTSIQAGLPTGVVPSSLTFFGSNLLLGTFGHGVFVKDVNGANWNAANTGLVNLNVTSVTCNGAKVFAGTDGNGVLVSDTSSINWSATSNTSISHTAIMGLNGTKIQAMAYNQGYIFASYIGGLLASSDDGVTWIQGGNQFNLPSYTDVNKISFVTTRVFVTTENNSLYSNALSELPVIVGPTAVNNSNFNSSNVVVSPNPNNGNFNLNLSNIKEKIIEINLIDLAGKLVEKYNTTQSQITVNASKGIYLLQVKTNSNIYNQRILIQ